MQLPSGLGENAHISTSTRISLRISARLSSFRAKAATTPRTRDGEPAMGSGQLRYWSMCTANRRPRPTAAPSTRTCRSTKTATSPSRSRQPRAAGKRGAPVRCPPGCPGGRTRRGSSSCATCCPPRIPGGGPKRPARDRQQTMGAYYPRAATTRRRATFEAAGRMPPALKSGRRGGKEAQETQEAPQAQEEAPEKASRLEP